MNDYIKSIKADDTESYYDVVFILGADEKYVHLVNGPSVTTIVPGDPAWKMVSEEEFRWIKEDVKGDGIMLRNIVKNNLI